RGTSNELCRFLISRRTMMRLIALPHRPTVLNARRNACALAEKIRDAADLAIDGHQPAEGCCCSMCCCKPTWDRRVQIRLNAATDEGVRVGFGVCHRRLLLAELRALLAREDALNDPNRAASLNNLRTAIDAIA